MVNRHKFVRRVHGLDAFVNYGTKRRLWNLIRAYRHWKRRDLKLTSYPVSLFIDTVNVCNLRCPFCPTGTGDLDRSRGFMPVDLFKRVIDEVAAHTYMVFLFDWGEPLLHPQLCDLIEYANGHRMYTCVHSNFSVALNEQKAEHMIRSGLSHLSLSVDGASQGVYEQYRKKGQLDLVLKNIELMIRTRQRMGLSRPHLRWRFLAFKHNEHEIDKAREIAKELGVDEFSVAGGAVEDPSWAAVNHYRYTFMDDLPPTCSWPWFSSVIHMDGGIGSCCYQNSSKYNLGSLKEEDFLSVWNNSDYRNMRAFLGGRSGTASDNLICRNCPAERYSDLIARGRRTV